MKRKYFIIVGVVIAFTAITISVLQWNKEIETTTEKAKDEIKIAEKEAQNETGEASNGSGAQGENGNQDGTATSNGTDRSSPDTTAESENGLTQSNGNNPNQTTRGTDGNLIGGSSSKGNSGSSPFKGTSLDEIKSAYRTIFSDLEVQEMSRLDQLLVQAKADYVGGKYTKSDLAVKYQDAAAALEQNADQTFNTIYNQLQIDLEKYGHSPSEAVEFRSEYQTKKQQRMTHVINELQNF